MSHISLGDACAASPRRSHRCTELDVHEATELILLAVVPSPVVHPLPEDLDGWLRAVLFLRGHVQVVYEHHGDHTERWTDDSLATLI